MTEASDNSGENAEAEHGVPRTSGDPGPIPMYGSWAEPSSPTPVRPGSPSGPVPPEAEVGSEAVPPAEIPPPPGAPDPSQTFAGPPPYGTPAAHRGQREAGGNTVPPYGTPAYPGEPGYGPRPSYPPEYGTPEYAASHQVVPVYVPTPVPADSTTLVLATILLIFSILALLSCLFLVPGLIGTVIAILALALNRSNPTGARRAAIGGWIAFGGFTLFSVLFFVLAASLD